MNSTNGELWEMEDVIEDNTAVRFEPLYTYADVAKLCRVSVQTVQEWVKRGMIESPLYLGFTARFTPAQVGKIVQQPDPCGTHPVTPSPRAEIGKKGGNPAARWKKKGKPATPRAKGSKTTKGKKSKHMAKSPRSVTSKTN